jgi:hypothetical protein
MSDEQLSSTEEQLIEQRRAKLSAMREAATAVAAAKFGAVVRTA